ncbi:hypothetical protein CDAR_262371 [Caerostris darwini]|uniref:Uncharacterized protein n=1 Tax=Caerostris darwini TaxID=1538125 RepID=A0AAV4QEQ1_9ARAC|nr:hypothetical protein CDAR_262371 [Caerostris darwini]
MPKHPGFEPEACSTEGQKESQLDIRPLPNHQRRLSLFTFFVEVNGKTFWLPDLASVQHSPENFLVLLEFEFEPNLVPDLLQRQTEKVRRRLLEL